MSNLAGQAKAQNVKHEVGKTGSLMRMQDTAENNVLRVLPHENAFYFYKAIGAPLGIKVNSLIEFSSKLKEVDKTSIRFHTERHDFENWIKILGDSALSGQIAALNNQTLEPEKLQTELSEIVQTRMNSLIRSTR